jgi:hypothetical protein
MANGNGVQAYAITLTAPGIACDGTTQPAGTIINFVRWDGVTPYTPQDYAGNTTNVSISLAQPGQQSYQPPLQASPSSKSNIVQQEFTVATGQVAKFAFGVGSGIFTGSGTIAAYGVWMPPLPSPGDQMEVCFLGTFTVTTLTVFDGAGNSLHAFANFAAPKRALLAFTSLGWQIIPN